MRKVLQNNFKTQEFLKTLPKIYLVGCWARFGVMDFPFTERFEKDNYSGHMIPIVYDYVDCNGTRNDYVMKPITHTTTGRIVLWTQNKNLADKFAAMLNKEAKY